MPVLFAAAEFQYGNERAVVECFHVVLYCRVTALSHNIRAHDEMVNLDKRTLSSAPWGGDPSVCLAPVRLALLYCPPFWQSWIRDESTAEHPLQSSARQVSPPGLSVLLPSQPGLSQGAEGQTFVLHHAALAAAWVLLPVTATCAGERTTSHTEFVVKCFF